jgi:hypothetical protein
MIILIAASAIAAGAAIGRDSGASRAAESPAPEWKAA